MVSIIILIANFFFLKILRKKHKKAIEYSFSSPLENPNAVRIACMEKLNNALTCYNPSLVFMTKHNKTTTTKTLTLLTKCTSSSSSSSCTTSAITTTLLSAAASACLVLTAVVGPGFSAELVPSNPPDAAETLSNVPQTLSGECLEAKDCKKARIQRPKSRKAESCTGKCVTSCTQGGDGSPGKGPPNIRSPLVVFKPGFRSRHYCLVECSDICNLIGDEDYGP